VSDSSPIERASMVAAVALVAVTAIHAALLPITHGDLWWGLAGGREVITHHTIPTSDIFSSTRLGAPWVNPEWSVYAVFYAVYAALGGGGLMALRVVLVLAVFGVATWVARSRAGAWFPALLVTAFAAWVCRPFLDLRPQLVTFVQALLFLDILDRFRRRASGGYRLLFVLLGLQVLWANQHGGYVLGPVLILATAGVEALKKAARLPLAPARWRTPGLLILTGLTAFALCAANPWGARAYTEPFTLSRLLHGGSPYFTVLEWVAPEFLRSGPLSPLQFWFFLGGFLLLTVAAARRWSRFDLSEPAIPLLVLGLLALPHRRFIPLFTLLAVPFAATCLAGLLERRRLPAARAAVAWIVLAAALVTTAPPLASMYARRNAFRVNVNLDSFPEDAVAFLDRAGVHGSPFNLYNWGGYLIYFRPRDPVFIDGRAQQVYPDADLTAYGEVLFASPGWSDVLRENDCGYVLVDSDKAVALARVLRASPEWTWIYADDQAHVFLRRDPRNSALLERFDRRELPLPDTAWSRVVLASRAGQLGDKDRLLADLEQAVAMAPGEERFRVYYAAALLNSGHRDRAAAVVADALRRFPGSGDLAALRDRLTEAPGAASGEARP